MADNFFRLVSFVVNICPEPLRKMFLQYASTDKGRIFTTLDDYLQFRKKDILGSRKFRTDQLILLYPNSSDADECQWDVSLLATLISELFASRIKGLETFMINEIREIRNSLQHLPNTSSLTDEDYKQFWQRIEFATLHIARQTDGPNYENAILAKIDEIRNDALSNIGDILRVWYEERIREMANNIEQLNTKIDEMSPDTKETASIMRKVTAQTPGPTGKKVKRLKTVDIILSGLKANFDATMKAELRSNFDPPPEVANIRTFLRDKHHVVVSGSFSSRYLETALAAIKELKYTPERCVEMSMSSDWVHIDPEDVDLVLCRDPFGKDHYEETKAMSMADVFKNILLASKEDTDAERIDIVLVTDSNILDEVRKRHDHEILEDTVKVFDVTTEQQPADLTLGPGISFGAKTANPVASNLREITRIFIQHYGDDKMPADDADIKNAREVFKKNKVVILVGPKEYGKVLAVAMASSYKPSQCLLLTRPDDTLLIDSDVCLAIIEQFAGKYRYSEDQVLKWYEMFDHIQLAVEAGRLNVVVTCEKDKLERCRQVFQHALLEHTVNLPENDFNNVKIEVVSEEHGDIPDTIADQSSEQIDNRRQKRHKKVRLNHYGEASIHIAAKRPFPEDLKKIIDSGADVNARDHANWTPLHDACDKGLFDNAECLLQNGADIGALGGENNTPLHEASMSGNIELVQMLLDHGSNPEQQNDVGKTPADVAASSDINALLIDACVKRNTHKENRHQKQHKKVRRNYHGETPLHIAAKRPNVDELKNTINNSADVNVRDNANWTPLHDACDKGLADNALCLLQAGADIEALGYGNNTPLHEASSSGNVELVQMLLDRGANPEQRNSDGHTPADVASSSDIFVLIDAYVNRNGNIDVTLPSEREMSMTDAMHEDN